MAERPLECSACKRPLAIDYTELVEGECSELSMCSTCPVLHQKLHGRTPEEVAAHHDEAAGVCCGECGTTLSAVRTGSPLGCAACYEVFSDVVAYELAHAGKISRHLGLTMSKSAPLHVGRGPSDIPSLSTDIKLIALDEALEATLKGEDYEGAAWLRDQIRVAKEEVDESQAG
jgi:protein arginine kinase activator